MTTKLPRETHVSTATGPTLPDDRRVSIVVPCYNRAAYLHVLLQSLTWSRTRPQDFEVLVVNDGGVDHIELVTSTWVRWGLDVRVLHLRTGGQPRNNATARNAGLAAARYPVVVQTDPDIVFVSDVISRVRQTVEHGVFCSCSGYYPLTREATLSLAFGPEGPNPSASAYLDRAATRPNQVLSPDGVGGLHGAFAIYKTDLERVGGYDESFAHWGWEDRELLVTLTGDAGLARRYMADSPVVHLWHPTLRGRTDREPLADQGKVSRVAWDIQLQRVCAEHPRSSRPRPSAPAGGHRRGTTLRLDAYEEWVDADTRLRHQHAKRLAAAGATDEARRVRPLGGQVLFDAHRLEASDLRAGGYPAIARALVGHALRRPWEHESPPDEWVAPTSIEKTAELLRGVNSVALLYDHVDLILEELALCEDALGEMERRDVVLETLARLPGGPVRAAAVRARSALRRGELAVALREATTLTGTPLGIELALLSGRFREARANLVACHREGVDNDHFQRLRLAGYRQLFERLAVSPGADIDTEPSLASIHPHDDDRTEFLFSVAIRSVRASLYIGGWLLLDRFLRSGCDAEPRLFEEGRQHLRGVRERIVSLVQPTAADIMLSALPTAPTPGPEGDRPSSTLADHHLPVPLSA